jgi:hypothetical protein
VLLAKRIPLRQQLAPIASMASIKIKMTSRQPYANIVPRGNTSEILIQLVLFVLLENTKTQTINQVQVVKYVAKVLTKMKTAVHSVNFVHLERN